MARSEYASWFEEADNDFEMAVILLNAKKFNGAVFHAQQAAEKITKSLQYFLNHQPWGHSITKLFSEIEAELTHVPPNIKSITLELDRHYTTSRYPDVLPGITPKNAYDEEKATEVVQKAKQFLHFIKSYMEEDAENA